MPDRKKELNALLKKYRKGKATPEERVFLEQYYAYFDREPAVSQSMKSEELEQTGQRIFNNILQSVATQSATPVVSIYKKTWFRIAAAAVLFFIAGTIYFVNNRTQKEPQQLADNSVFPDISAPVSNKATITLSGGQKIILDSIASGQIAMQDNVRITKNADGEIVYDMQEATAGSQTRYNTLSNPRGSKAVTIILNDGSHVWLNAESSITYPTAFAAGQREVDITGEAYFEVAHDASKPFRVRANGTITEVLGTHFNINSYKDEEATRITLLEGRVAVTLNGMQHPATILAPSQQAMADNGTIKQLNNVNIDEVIAWKNGLFHFDNADIKTVMRQVARWYDIDVRFENGGPAGTFTGEIGRTLTLRQLLDILDNTKIRYRMQGKILVLTK